MIYNQEDLITCAEDIKHLTQAHWEEVANNKDIRPLDINWDLYCRMPNLYVYTMRDDGDTKARLVGYAAFYIANHPHYQTWKHAVSDVYYVDPEHRGEDAVHFFQYIERALKREGVNIVNVQDKVHKTRERFFHHLGFKTVEQVYEKVL